MLLLGLAVFCWGLHDKLSLYAPPSVPPPSAKAKLLSQTEQPSAQARAAMPQPPQNVPPLLLLLFTALVAGLCRSRREQTLVPSSLLHRARPPVIAPLWHRPPPALRLL